MPPRRSPNSTTPESILQNPSKLTLKAVFSLNYRVDFSGALVFKQQGITAAVHRTLSTTSGSRDGPNRLCQYPFYSEERNRRGNYNRQLPGTCSMAWAFPAEPVSGIKKRDYPRGHKRRIPPRSSLILRHARPVKSCLHAAVNHFVDNPALLLPHRRGISLPRIGTSLCPISHTLIYIGIS